jgi:hypothetical protein
MWGQPPSAVRSGEARRLLEAKEMHLTDRESESRAPRPKHQLKFRQLPGFYAIVRFAPGATIPRWATKGSFTSITRTADELSVVCSADSVPKDVDPGLRWICFKLEGPFAFSQTGILLSFIEPLSYRNVPIFAISTYDTDYVLVQEEHSQSAFDALIATGHELIGDR